MAQRGSHGPAAGPAPEPASQRAPGSEERVRQMVDDPAGYFARSRKEAESEARRYVARRLARPHPA